MNNKTEIMNPADIIIIGQTHTYPNMRVTRVDEDAFQVVFLPETFTAGGGPDEPDGAELSLAEVMELTEEKDARLDEDAVNRVTLLCACCGRVHDRAVRCRAMAR